jgi:D-alanine-D-alanine ligase
MNIGITYDLRADYLAAGMGEEETAEFDRPNFIEVNPLAGRHPEHSDLCIIADQAGIPYTEFIGSILAEIQQRMTAQA